MEINFCSLKCTDGEVLEVPCVEEKKVYSEFKIGHGQFKVGMG